jgi:thiol-disulfide isomerase/thioredoxin
MFSSKITALFKVMRRSGYMAIGGALAILIAGVFSSAPVVASDRIAAPLTGATQWLNSTPLNSEMLRGKVVLVDFWTYSCSNCLNALPHVKAWDEKYRAQGLVVIGVHTPEFAAEQNQQNVEQAIKRLGVTYPVAMDNHYAIWNAYGNKYWPAQYLIDAQGQLRYQHYGEGAYNEIESKIHALLEEAQLGTSAAKR